MKSLKACYTVARWVCALMVLCAQLWGAVPQRRALAAPPVPFVPTPQPGHAPKSVAVSASGTQQPPTPGTLSAESDRARLMAAMTQATEKLLAAKTSRFSYTLSDVAVAGDWAYSVAQTQADAVWANGEIHLLARKNVKGAWRIITPQSDDYAAQVDAAPAELISAASRDVAKNNMLALQAYAPPKVEFGPVAVPEGTPASIQSASSGVGEAVWVTGTIQMQSDQEKTIQLNLDADHQLHTSVDINSGISLPAEVNLLPSISQNYPRATSFQFPISGYKVTGFIFGKVVSVASKGNIVHLGEDVLSNAGTPVFATAAGLVVYSAYHPYAGTCEKALSYGSNYGRVIVVEHHLPDGDAVGDYIVSLYAHLRSSDVAVRNGDEIRKGQLLGYVGSILENGCTSPHLHFQFKKGKNGFIPGYALETEIQKHLNPSEFIQGRLIDSGNPGTTCQKPTLTEPLQGTTSTDSNLKVKWNPVACTPNHNFKIRVKNESGQDVVPERNPIGLSDNFDIPSDSWNRRLRVAVRANLDGATWSDEREFTISKQVAQTCTPNADQIALYENDNFGGQCVVKGVGNYPNESDLAPISNSASSIRVGTNVRAIVYPDPNFNGTSRTFNEGDNSFAGDTPDVNNAISSLKVELRAVQINAPILQSPAPATNAYVAEGQTIGFGWQASLNAAKYRLEWWPADNPSNKQQVNEITGNSHNPLAPPAGIKYGWRVVAIAASGQTAASSEGTFIVDLNSPASLAASAAGCTQVNLAWADRSGNEEGYRVYRNNSLIATLPANATSYQDTGASGNTSYDYQVRAYRGNLASASSNSAGATTPTCTTTPSVPTLSSPSDGAIYNAGSTVQLCWSGSGTHYSLELSGGPAGTQTFTPLASTCQSLNTPQPGYAYSWRVSAHNSAGASNWSNARTFTIRLATPINVAAQAPACNQVNFSWGDVANATGYVIYRNSSALASVGANVTSYSDNTVGASSSYAYQVKATRGGVESALSASVNASTPACAPTDTTAPQVAWESPTTEGQTYYVNGETVVLRASASDNVGVQRVHFSRWDAVNLAFVNIGDDYTAPYEISLGSSNLNLTWNEILIWANDAAGNESARGSIFLYRQTPQPNIQPYTRPNYAAPVVLASISGTTWFDQVFAGQTTYVDYFVANTGSENSDGQATELWIDNQQYIRHDHYYFGPGEYDGRDDFPLTISAPGWHTVRLKADVDSAVSESDESDNVLEFSYYWAPTAPFIDDFQGGLHPWEPTGLWHRIQASHVYRATDNDHWWFGQDSDGTYNTGGAVSGTLTSPPIFIPNSLSNYYLRFDYRYETETQGTDWDKRLVQLSVDDGPFNTVLQLADDGRGFWRQSPAIDLNPYRGHAIRMRFLFDSVDGLDNSFRGWYLDNFRVTTDAPPSCNDTQEPNDTFAQASSVAYGQFRYRQICPAGDRDLFVFAGEAGDNVVLDIDAQITGSTLDSYITLMDAQGNILDEHDDENSNSKDSKLGYVLPTTGNYYVKVRSFFHPSSGGPGQYYELFLRKDITPPVASFVSPTDDSYLVSSATTLSVTASDFQSGIQRVEFLWHNGDWDNSEWEWLGADINGLDGWSWNFSRVLKPDFSGGAFYAWVFDWGDNWTGVGVWNVGLDRLAPIASVAVTPLYGGNTSRRFFVNWDSDDSFAGTTSFDVDYARHNGLAFGSWESLAVNSRDYFTSVVGLPDTTYKMRVRARDAAGNLSAYVSSSSINTTVCTTEPDTYEPNDSTLAAQDYAASVFPYQRTFHMERDEDWLTFKAQKGITYTIEATSTNGSVDTVMTLFAPNASTVIEINDDVGEGDLSSRIIWAAPADSIYVIRVRHFDDYSYGCNTAYALLIEKQIAALPKIKNFLPFISRD